VSQSDAGWTDGNQVFCNLEARLYCFEQSLRSSAVPALSRAVLGAMAILLLLAGAWRVRESTRHLA
jgi:hypothetical protein